MNQGDVGSKTTYGSGIESLYLTSSIFHEDFLLTPGLFSLKTKKNLHRHPLIGVYRFYKNWSTETFGKKKSKKWASE
jgi:hypothetical protein